MSRHKVYDNDTVQYFNSSNELHREDGPAIECANGDKVWYINGRFIRQNTTNHFAKLSRLSLRCFVFQLFEYREIGEVITEEVNLSYNNFKELVRVAYE